MVVYSCGFRPAANGRRSKRPGTLLESGEGSWPGAMMLRTSYNLLTRHTEVVETTGVFALGYEEDDAMIGAD
jgi:hypothetical protein